MPSITASPEMLAAIFEDEKIPAREIFRRAQANEPADGFALSASKQVRFTVETTSTPCRRRTSSRSCGAAIRS